MRNIIILILFFLSTTIFSENSIQHLYRIVVDNKVGYIDKESNIVIKPIFDDEYTILAHRSRILAEHVHMLESIYSRVPVFNYGDPFAEGFARVKYRNKFGYIDVQGNFIISAKFDDASFFKEGRAAVLVGNKWGYINKKGTIIIKPEYEEVYYFFEDRAWVKKNGKYGFIDNYGRIILPIQYRFYHKGWRLYDARRYYGFREGRAYVGVDEKFGFIDQNGKFVIEPKYDYWYSDFKFGYAVITVNGLDGIIDKQDNIIVKPQYYQLGSFSEDCLAIFRPSLNEKEGYINTKGDIAIPPIYDRVYHFYEGRAKVTKGNDLGAKYGYINTKGEYIVEPIFSLAEDFRDGVAVVMVKGNTYSGCIDKDGNYVIPPIVKGKIMRYCGDVAIYQDNFLYGLVNKEGKVIVEPQYYYMGPFIDGVAEVWLRNEKTLKKKYGYINKKGEYIWEPTK